MLIALLVSSVLASPHLDGKVVTTKQLQADFEHATPCKDVDGRKVWKGRIAFFIQSYVYNGDDTESGADAVLPGDNTAETMKEFEDACAHASSPKPFETR